MAGNSRQKKHSGSSFSLFSLFKNRNPRAKRSDDSRDDSVKLCRVYPGDEDRGRWVADPAIDKKATAYINSTINGWENAT